MTLKALSLKASTLLLPCLMVTGCASSPAEQNSGIRPLGEQGLDQLQSQSLCRRQTGVPEPVAAWAETGDLERAEAVHNSLSCQAKTLAGDMVYFQALPTKGSTAAITFGYDERVPGSIGILLAEDNGRILVQGVHPEGPAADSGLQSGDQILGAAPDGNANFISFEGMDLKQVAGHIRGDIGEPVGLAVLRPGEVQTRQVRLTRGKMTRTQWVSYQRDAERKAVEQLAIPNNSGPYLSPYTSDGVVAEWVNKAINAQMGGATGSAVGAAAGAYAGQKLMENVPGGGMLGGLFGGVAGSKAGEAVGRDTAIQASGGMAHIRSTSDISFQTIDDMARWLVATHGGKPNFGQVVQATTQIYPALKPALAEASQ